MRVRAGQLVRVRDSWVGDGKPRQLPERRAHNSRLFPQVGENFVTDLRAPVLALADDTSPGRHNMLIPACDPERFRLLGSDQPASCVSNVHDALAELGLSTDVVPHPVNLFMNILVNAGTLQWLPAASAPGEAITFLSHLDIVVVLSACPQDLVGINGGTPTELGSS